jgi:hypothetical protein
MRSQDLDPEISQANTPGLRITKPDEAERLVRSALLALDRLEPLVEEETRLMRIGKVRPALAMAVEKHKAAQVYTRCLELLKGNAIAIGRFRPENLEMLRLRHQGFSKTMGINMAVVSTARTVSEGLVRELADSLGRDRGIKTYAPSGVSRKKGTLPLSVSKMS